MKNIMEVFKEAVKSYLGAIKESFYSRVGDEPDRKPYEKKIVSLYRKIPTEARVNHLYFLLKTMSEPAGETRLTEWRRDLALELVKKLEKI